MGYVIGYILSLALTIEAYLLTVNGTFSPKVVIAAVVGLAIVQLMVQLFYFMHFDRMVRAPWNIVMFLFMAMVVAIVVFGSWWIMENLDYHTTSPAKTEEYMKRQEGF